MGTGMMRNESDAFVGGDARRGSALVIVIGTLALISVFAAVYISIGRSDRRTAATVRIQADQDDITDVHASYIAGVIGDDRLAVYTQTADPTAPVPSQFVRREVTDAPYTDWSVRSESGDPWALANPVGEHRVQFGLGGQLDVRVPYDPWLASTRPTYLGPDDVLLRPFSREFAPTIEDSKNYLDKRDWLQISNLAPDLRFVNLFNLRPHGANGRAAPVGGFDSEPGWGETSIDGRRVRRMSEGLSLLNVRGDFALQAYDPVPQNEAWLPGHDVPVALTFTDGATVRDVPAVWTMYQRFMFMPMDQPFISYNRDGNVSTWGDPDYPAYQYADADGDGMADSRWIELTRAQTPHGETNSTPRNDIERLYDAKDMRVFAGIRVMDLSALVNINTATDQLAAPTVDEPLGSTPAEIDLRRLLSMQDSAEQYSGAPFAARAPLSLANTHRPSFYRGTGGNSQQQILERTEADYVRYTHFDVTPLSLQTDSNAMRIGRAAYSAIGEAIRTQSDLSGRSEYANAGQQVPWVPVGDFALSEGTRFVDGSGNPDAEQRLEYYQSIAGIDPSRLGRAGLLGIDPALVGTDRGGAGLFDTEDLAELLTYHGLNDPDVNSRLERVVSGRFENGFGEGRLSPLLSNRPLSLDRGRHGQARDAANSNPNRPRPVDGRVAVESMATFELTPRARMTTLSGHVPLRPGAYTESVTVGVDPVRRAGLLDDESGLSIGATTEAFRIALAGELDSFRDKGLYTDGAVLNTLWNPDLTANQVGPYARLFYGHRGPELALRVAAHVSVNAADASDGGDSVMTARTVLFDNARSDDLKEIETAVAVDSFDPSSSARGAQLAMLYPGAAQENVLDLDDGFLSNEHVLPDGRLGDGREAVTVYGVEAVPVITEVASLFVYSDAPDDIGGDVDFRDVTPNPPFGIPLGAPTEVTLDGTVSDGNRDLMLEVLAVQLMNPFDVAIQLSGTRGGDETATPGVMGRLDGGDPGSNLRFEYYFEYNGRFFKLGEYMEYNGRDGSPRGFDYSAEGGPGFDEPIGSGDPEYRYRDLVLAPGEARVFYAISQPRFAEGFVSGSQNLFNSAADGPDELWARAMEAHDSLPIGFATTPDPAFDIESDGFADGYDADDWTGPAREWIEAQLTVGTTKPAQVHPFNPRNGELVEVGAYRRNLTGGGPPDVSPSSYIPGRTAKLNQVRLWRKHVGPNEETLLSSGNGIRENVPQNDILVDRLFLEDPSSPVPSGYLFVPLDGSVTIADSIGYREDFDPGPRDCANNTNGERNDNSGLSVVRFASVRRRDPDSSTVTGGANPRITGRVHPWMLQSRENPQESFIQVTNKQGHPGAHMDAFPDILDAGFWFDPCGGSLGAPATSVSDQLERDKFGTLGELVIRTRVSQDQGNRDRRRVVTTIGLNPIRKSTIDLWLFRLPRDEADVVIQDRFSSVELSSNEDGLDLDYSASGLRPEIALRRPDAKRVGDALLAMGIGPAYAPLPTADPGEPTDESWMTLPEALWIGLGFGNPTANTSAADTVWHESYPDLSVNPLAPSPVLDNLNIRIDDFVASLDVVQDGQPFDPAFDVLRGTGVPMALGVIDQLRAIDAVVLPRERAAGDIDPLTQAVFGTVNLNTAPLEVLRLLPGLSPSAQQYFDPAGSLSGVERSEWWANASGLGIATLAASQPDDHPDAAAGLQSYRDRVFADPLLRSVRVDPTAPSVLPDLSFGPSYDPVDDNGQLDSVVENHVTEPLGAYLEQRGSISGVEGIRGTPGFGSAGEVLMASVDPASTAFPGLEHLGMQFYGTDGTNLGAVGSETINPLGAYGTGATGVEDDYAERLAIASGILNTVSVRSDYYAVWFVIQGFRESDLVGLLPDDPLVPSLKKRFVMVVDRTNVVNPGDEPRIVLMREVPL